MSCNEVREELVALLDGELEPAVAAVVRAHVGACAACAAEDRALRKTREVFDETFAAGPAAPSRFEEVWRALGSGAAPASPRRRSKVRPARRGGRRIESRRAVSVAAAAAVILAILAYRALPGWRGPVRAPVGAEPEAASVARVPDAEVPAELLAAPEMFVDFVIVRRLDKLKNLQDLLDEPGADGQDPEVGQS